MFFKLERMAESTARQPSKADPGISVLVALLFVKNQPAFYDKSLTNVDIQIFEKIKM